MKQTLTIRLLGRFTLELDGKPVTGLPSRKAEALLAYLVCQKRPFSREILAEFLWDDRPPEQSLANLRSLLSGLRRKLKPFLIISRQTVQFDLDSSYELDSEQFLTRLSQIGQQANGVPTAKQIAEIETAVSLYYGAFLEGFHIRDSRGFEEWVTVERERYQRLAVQAWQTLIDHYLQAQNYSAGVEYAVRLLETDPLNEYAHRQMMLLLARNNQRHAALQQYDVCARVLEKELGVPPSAETRRLYEQIRLAQTTVRHNLPPQSTPFVGRKSELNELSRLLSQENGRIVTLLGPGGIGKTRLAIHFAEEIVQNQPGQYLHGIRFIPLQTVEDTQFLMTTIAEAVAYKLRGSESPADQLANYLKQREMLLILDNFEHLAASSVNINLLSTLIQHCPQLKLLVTSQVRLQLPDEVVFDMRGLNFPRQQSFVPIENYAAVQLFIQNARRYLHAFQPSEADIEAIINICRLLDGIPLGIELASAWIRFLSCQEIATDLSQNLDVLEQSGDQSHPTLHAAFDRSWGLLTQDLQRALCKLSLFRGGFSREAAVSISDASLSHLVRLIDSSWLRRQEQGGEVRFEMLVIMRQYAAEQFEVVVSEKTAVFNRFIQYYATFLAKRRSQLEGGAQRQTLADIATEIENIRYMVRLALKQKAVEPIAQAVDSLFYFYDTQSQFLAGATLFQRMGDALATFPHSPEQQTTLAKVQARLGWFLFHQGQYQTSWQLLQGSLNTLREVGAVEASIFSLNYLGAVTRHFGDYEKASELLREALAIAEKHQDQFQASISLNILGQIASLAGNYEEARTLCQKSHDLKQEMGDRWGMTHSLSYLGRVAQALGEPEEAQRLFEQSQALSEDFGDRRGVAFAYQNLGDVALLSAVYETAVSHYNQSLQLYDAVGDRLGVAFSQAKLGQATALIGESAKARRMLVSSLENALTLGSNPVMMEGILGTAVLHLQLEEAEKTAVGLHFVAKRDESSQAQKERATHLLAQHSLPAVDKSPDSIVSFVQRLLTQEKALVIQ